MSGNGKEIKKKFNIVRRRGTPTEVTLQSGHVVKKEKKLYYKDGDDQWQMIDAADYHGEHFVYVDPVYNEDGPHARGHMAFMCTCGSDGVIVGPSDGQLEDSGRYMRLVVCRFYHTTLQQTSVGRHADQTGRGRWV
jgi:hypothetical protein